VARDIDILTAPGLKHLRDRWWDASFDAFVTDTLQPRAGDRVLEVGAGAGLTEVTLGLLAPGDVRYVGIDRRRDRLRQAHRAARDRGLLLALAAAQAAALPFGERVFASALCVGVLQYATDPAALVRELARVTREAGRVLIVEPDNTARYWFSSLASGMRAFALSQEFQRAAASSASASASGSASPQPDAAVGPRVAALCRAEGIDPIAVEIFPVSGTRLGAPVPTVWQARREDIARLVAESPRAETRAIGEAWLRAVEEYAEDSARAGPAFLEIQHTMLVATVGQVRQVRDTLVRQIP
jgi:ubiquinone/menaquinone biosynthesis C-methylase UbiE